MADKKLSMLTDQLRHTEQRVANAAEHLVKLNELKNRSADPLPESEREDMERKLDSLQQTVSIHALCGRVECSRLDDSCD